MKKSLFLLLFFSVLAFSSCKKEGCTNNNADNFDTEAKKEDNTCLYSASAIFWIDASTSNSYQSSFVNELKVYVDGSYIGKMSTNSSLLKAPDCLAGGGVSYFEDLQTSNSKIIKYEVKYLPLSAPGSTPDEVVEFEGSLKLNGGSCQSFQLQ